MRRALIALACAAASLEASHAAARAPNTPIVGQEALDFLASFRLPQTPAKPGGPYLPAGAFAGWSAADKSAAPGYVIKMCILTWTLMHDDPNTRFLPAGSPPTDEAGLGAEVCMAGHMPPDWPGRPAQLRAAQAILDRAAAQGSKLRMPATIKP